MVGQLHRTKKATSAMEQCIIAQRRIFSICCCSAASHRTIASIACTRTFAILSVQNNNIPCRRSFILPRLFNPMIRHLTDYQTQRSANRDRALATDCSKRTINNSNINSNNNSKNITQSQEANISGGGEQQENCEDVDNSNKMKDKLKASAAELKERLAPMKENYRTIPNALCAVRIVMSPIIGYLVLVEGYSAALGLFVVAGVTDLVGWYLQDLDGWIARRFESQQSALGSILDPVADKMLVSFLFLALTYNGLIPVLLTCLIILRDSCLMTAGFITRYRSVPPPRTLSRYFDPELAPMRLRPTQISKINTGLQLALVAASLASPVFGFVDHTAIHCLWWITGATTLYSGLNYIWVRKEAMQIIRKGYDKQARKK